jgi:Chaperone of endosialidase
MSATTVTTITKQQVSQLDYLFKKVTSQKVKTDGLNTDPVISAANESVSVVDVVRADRFWSDASHLVSGPSSAVTGGYATARTRVQCTDIHRQAGTDYEAGLFARAWRTSITNWISTDFHPNYALTVQIGPASSTPTSYLDATAYPYAFDYGSGVLTFIGNVPPTLVSNAGQVLYITGYTYAGIVGVAAVSGTFQAPNVSVASNVLINTLGASNDLGIIDCTFTYLSNIKEIDVAYITNTTSNGVINVTNTTLSNINTTLTSSLYVDSISPNANANINVTNSTFSNVSSIYVGTIVPQTGNSGTIAMSQATLNDVHDLQITHTLRTDSIQPNNSGANLITFNNADVNSIRNLSVTTSLNVAGELVVTNVAQSNTDQLIVTNAGLGPAFVVNQTGKHALENVSEFMSGSNTVMYTNYSGQTAFGSFGFAPSNYLPTDALVYVENPTGSNQPAAYIKQDATGNTLTLIGNSGAPSVNFTSNGLIGLGTTTPVSRIECSSDYTTPFLKLTTATSNGFVVNADGRVGVLTSPDSVYAVNVNGTVNTTSTITSNLSSQSSNINVNANSLSNVKSAYIGITRATQSGTSNAPAFTFDANDSTGMYTPGTNMLAFTTGSNERIRIDSAGKVGINSSAPAVTFDINATDALRLPVGTSAQRPTGVNGYIRYNTTYNTFEGYGPGGVWGTLGGVNDDVTKTSITAELTPGNADCNIRFYIGGAPKMVLGSNGNLGIHCDSNSIKYDLTVNGTSSTCNLYINNTLSTLSSSSNINVDTKSFSNVSNLDVASFTSTLGNGVINANLVSISNISNVRTSNIETSIITSTLDTINVTNLTLSNINTTKSSNLQVNKISGFNSTVDMSSLYLSNIASTLTSNLQVNAITSLSAAIDVTQQTLSNINTVKTANVETTTLTSTVDAINVSTKSLSNVNIVRAQNNASGSASAPSYTFNADTTTGMFQPSSHNLSFSTNGSESLSILSSGKVGINSTSPEVQLVVNSTDAMRIPVGTTAQRPTTGANGYIRYNSSLNTFEGYGPGGVWGTLGGVNDDVTKTSITAELTPGSGDCNIRFYIAGTPQMVLGSNGNLGIHCDSNSIPYDLTVNGSSSTCNLYTNVLSTLNTNSNIDVSGKNLSNVQVLDVAKLRATRNNGWIDAQGNSLSNINNVYSTTLQVSTVDSTADYINVSTKSLSNITDTQTSNLQVGYINSTGAYISVSGKSFSNITDTQTSNLQVTAINSTANYINVSGKSLSNITDAQTSNLQVGYINSTGAYISVSGKSFSNITDTQTSNLQVTAINSTANYINVSGKSLSNITDTQTSNLQVGYINSTGAYISVSGKSFSNITDTQTSNLQVTAINSTANYINVSGKSLSNITDTQTSNLQVTAINSTADYINVSGKSLSNITDSQTSNLQVSYINSTGAYIGVSGKSFSNITDTQTSNLQVTAINSTQSYINVSGKSLSNITDTKTGNLQVSTISTVATGSVIKVSDGITLSNLNTLKTTNITTNTIHGDPTNNMIDMSAASIYNLQSLSNTGSLFTNSINAFSSNVIDFNANDVKNINNLFINESITVGGEFFITNVNTCNAERMAIDNAGAGPGLTVNQNNSAGTNAVATFMSSSNLAFFIDGKRQAVFGGNFGATVPTSLPHDAQVYIESVSADHQDALYIKQDNSSFNAVTINYADTTSCNVVVDGSGRIGVGTAPAARLHVYHDDSATTPFMKLSTAAQENTFVINANGTVGIGTAGSTGSTVSIVTKLEVPTITPPSGNSSISMSSTTLASVNTVQAAQASASAPTYTFTSDTASGMYQSASSEVSIATGGAQRLVVDSAGKVGINTASPRVHLDIYGTDAIGIPSGTTAQRPIAPVAGQIRYNTTLSTYEGYGPGSVWGSLGGVSDVVTQTKITAQLDASTHDCNIRFYIANKEQMILSSNGNLGIHLADDTVLPGYDLTVNGTTSTTNLYTNKLSTLGASHTIDIDNMYLSNVSNIQANVSVTVPLIDTTTLKASASSSIITASNISLSNMRSVDTANLYATMSSGLINVNTCSLSNITSVYTSNITLSNIMPTVANGTINVNSAYMSNIYSVETSQLYNVNNLIDVRQTEMSNLAAVETQKLYSVGGVIDVHQTTLSNINYVKAGVVNTPSIDSPTTKQISFNYSRVLDIDSLVVRSNITISIAGSNTITNLPNNVVQLNGNGVIPDTYISSNIVRLSSSNYNGGTSNTINPSLIPGLYTSDRASFVKTNDKVGIGIKTPAQKLHVYGNQCVTGGNLGIGTTTISSMLHVYNDNGLSPGVRFENPGSVDMFAVYGGSNNYPALYVNASCNIGIGKNNPSYALDVNGTGNFNTVRASTITSSGGLVDCSYGNFSNLYQVNASEGYFTQLTVTGTTSFPRNITTSTADIETLSTSTINSTSSHINMSTGLNITGYDTSLVSGTVPVGTKIGLNVTNYIVAQATLTTSDKRAKRDISESSLDDDLDSVLSIPVKRFKYVADTTTNANQDTEMLPGFIAQEVEPIAPFAVKTISSALPSIMSSASKLSDDTIGGIPSNLVSTVMPGDRLKVLIDNKEFIMTVAATAITVGKITFEENVPSGSNIFVYGKIVDDFKVLDSERLLPLVFNAVKTMHGKFNDQQKAMATIQARLDALERLPPVFMPAPAADPVPAPAPAPVPAPASSSKKGAKRSSSD